MSDLSHCYSSIVTLVHRGSRLLEFIGPEASQKALDWLTAKKVEVILGLSVDLDSASDGLYRTFDGETELKQAYLAWAHAELIVKNLKVLMSGDKGTKLASHKPRSAIALVSLGRKEAVAQFPFMTISGCIPRKIKAGDLFIGKTKKKLRLESK
ncbi:hypothetical protein CRG98_007978 [Punica granatum]|uniref:Uncharacterized protein n=1 Tax=Punica granatum TaxID=22663 RepID=A0A2I0KT50_PUNGR|nr:hypothetical protein CRG98_007978 [Punica granatum]